MGMVHALVVEPIQHAGAPSPAAGAAVHCRRASDAAPSAFQTCRAVCVRVQSGRSRGGTGTAGNVPFCLSCARSSSFVFRRAMFRCKLDEPERA
eukprot:1794158-Prymnesium_polylepis.1